MCDDMLDILILNLHVTNTTGLTQTGTKATDIKQISILAFLLLIKYAKKLLEVIMMIHDD